jgi:hypothetical protein
MTQQDEIAELPISWSCYHIPPGGKRPVLNAVIEKIPIRIRALLEDEAPIVARVLKGAPESPGEECGWYRVLRNDDGRASLYASFVPTLFPLYYADRFGPPEELERKKNADYYMLRGELSDRVMSTITRLDTQNAWNYGWSLNCVTVKKPEIGRVIDSSRDEALERLQSIAEKMRFINGVLYAPSTGPKIHHSPRHGDIEIQFVEPMWREGRSTPADIRTIETQARPEGHHRYLNHLKIDQAGIFCADHQWYEFLRSVIDIYFSQVGITTTIGARPRSRPLLGLSKRRLDVFHEIGDRCMSGIWPGERDKAFLDRASAFCEMAYAENKYGLAQSYAQFQTALAGLRDVPGPRPISERIEATGLLPPPNPTQEISSFRR